MKTVTVNKPLVIKAVREILTAIGEDPDREGLRDTPSRVAEMFEEIFSGYNHEPEYRTFTQSGDLVVLSGIRFYSMCEHHMLPFFGVAHVAYVPNGEVLGLSKFARIVNKYSRRLQIQERMTQQIADEVQEITGSKDVMVITEAYHMCMIMRGVRNPAPTVVSALRGRFFEYNPLRQEALQLIAPYRLKPFPL